MNRMSVEEMHRGQVILLWDGRQVATLVKGIDASSRRHHWHVILRSGQYPVERSSPCLLIACRQVIRHLLDDIPGRRDVGEMMRTPPAPACKGSLRDLCNAGLDGFAISELAASEEFFVIRGSQLPIFFNSDDGVFMSDDVAPANAWDRVWRHVCWQLSYTDAEVEEYRGYFKLIEAWQEGD